MPIPSKPKITWNNIFSDKNKNIQFKQKSYQVHTSTTLPWKDILRRCPDAHLFYFGNIQMQVIFITPIHKVFSLLVAQCIFIILIFPTSSVSSANFTRGHDSSVLLHSTVYSENRKGAKTTLRCPSVCTNTIADDSTILHFIICLTGPMKMLKGTVLNMQINITHIQCAQLLLPCEHGLKIK